MEKIKLLFVVALVLVAHSVSAADYYRVSLTRAGQDLYRDTTSGVIVKTRYCYEYVWYDDAVLQFDSLYGYNIGKVVFSNGQTCDVERLLQ